MMSDRHAAPHPDQDVEMAPDGLIVCPTCDLLLREPALSVGTRARCPRCHAVLFSSRASAMTRVVMLAATALILTFAVVSFPFLKIRAGGLEQKASLIDTFLAYSNGLLLPLTALLAILIVGLPFLRFAAVIYTLAPMALGSKAARYAPQAFRLVERLQPWAMAEVFVVGVAVALVKIAGLATVDLGPAFWSLAALVAVNVAFDAILCRFTVWRTLERRRAT